jgi:hypothetical protein
MIWRRSFLAIASISVTDNDLTSASDEKTSAFILSAEVVDGELFNSDNGINIPQCLPDYTTVIASSL